MVITVWAIFVCLVKISLITHRLAQNTAYSFEKRACTSCNQKPILKNNFKSIPEQYCVLIRGHIAQHGTSHNQTTFRSKVLEWIPILLFCFVSSTCAFRICLHISKRVCKKD